MHLKGNNEIPKSTLKCLKPNSNGKKCISFFLSLFTSSALMRESDSVPTRLNTQHFLNKFVIHCVNNDKHWSRLSHGNSQCAI